jgi:hypothetical protein
MPLGVGVPLLDQEPILACLATLPTEAHERETSPQALSFEIEFENASVQALVRVTARSPKAAIPQQHRASPVLALRDRALEMQVLNGVIFRPHREPLVRGV